MSRWRRSALAGSGVLILVGIALLPCTLPGAILIAVGVLIAATSFAIRLLARCFDRRRAAEAPTNFSPTRSDVPG